MSQFNPGDYFTQQQVPYFGSAFDNSYCSKTPSTKLWGFGYNGCLVPSDPSYLANTAANPYTYVSKKTGKKQPTAALFSNDTQSGKNSVKFGTKVYNTAGFKVVAGNSQMPVPPVSDYTPYAQAMLTADNGNPPTSSCAISSPTASRCGTSSRPKVSRAPTSRTCTRTSWSRQLSGAVQHAVHAARPEHVRA